MIFAKHACLLAVAVLAASPVRAEERVQLRLDASEAEAVLDLLALRAAGRPLDDAFARLFATEPYVRLGRREAGMGRAFSDEEFRAFVLSPPLAAKADELRRTLDGWRAMDLGAVAARILPYLPAGAVVRATVYPSIKPRPNSFVFETTTDPAIFLHLDPQQSASAFANTVAHECHHIGFADAGKRYDEAIAALPPDARKAAEWMGALGEGLAVLAAAGSADAHPMADFPLEDQVRWDQDARFGDQQLAALDRFLADVIEGGFARPDVADHVAFTFFGYRGPWYAVGHRMGVVVERRYGRAVLLACMEDPRALLATYNEAASTMDDAGAPLPRWSGALLEATGACPISPGEPARARR